MNRNLSKAFILSAILTVNTLTGCAHNRINERIESPPIESSAPEAEVYSSPIASIEINPTVESEKEGEHTFTVCDIFVPGIPILDNVPFMSASIEEIQANGLQLEKAESTEHESGHYIYWKSEGIVYVTHSSGQNLVAVILNRDGIALNCGLKKGMTEAEISQLDLAFKKFIKEDLHDGTKSIAFASSFIRDEGSPINTEDFDSLYVYVGTIPEEEMTEYGINTTSCISVIALIKNGSISNIILDLPTAG